MYNYITYVIFYTNTTSIKTVKTTVVLTVLIEAVLVITRYMNELSYRLYNIQYRPPLPVTLGTSCKRSIKANALLVCMALLQARVTCFILVAFSLKQPLSSLQPLRQVQAPTTNRLELGVTYDGNGGIPLFYSTTRGVCHTK